MPITVTRINLSTQSKRATWVDVRGYGAKGDGTTDDSTAINLAIAAVVAAGGGTVYFPGPSVFIIKAATLTIGGSGVTLLGDGQTISIIKFGNASSVYTAILTGANSDIVIDSLGFEGNFINQTYPTAVLNTAIDASDAIRLSILNCRFHGFGFSSAADIAFTQVISLYRALDFQIRDNTFVSNMAYEINMNSANSGAITGNTFGDANLSESRTNTDWWDTQAAGFGTISIGTSNVYFAGNRMYGGSRAMSGDTPVAFSYLISDGGALVQGMGISICSNVFKGLGNSRGTVSVTNGSGTVTGLNTYFWSGDVGRAFVVDGDTTLYKVTVWTSATQITVSPVMVRASGSSLRYQYQNSGDAISVAPVSGLLIDGNTVEYSGDMGMDIGANATQAAQHTVISNNIVKYSQVAGLYIGGSVFNVIVSNNLFLDNNRKALTDHKGAIECSPDNQGVTTPQPMWHMTFIGNQFMDDQATPTQLYAFQIETGQVAHIFSNTLVGNNCFISIGGGVLFNPEVNSAMIGQMFNFPSFSSPVQMTPVAFADLGIINASSPPNGTMVYCYDGRSIADGAVAGSTAAGSGTGAFFYRLAGVWKL